MRYTFGAFALDTDRHQLEGPDGEVHVEPQVFDVLELLVANRDRVVPKMELLDTIWGSRFVSEAALTSRIKSARRAVDDSGTSQHVIRTVHGTGYRFVAEVREGPDATAPAPTPTGGPDGGAHHSAARRLPGVDDLLRGRQGELRELEELVAGGRLVTLLGPGGTGKTRLAVEFARGQQLHPDAAFVDLAAVRDEHVLGQAVALALGIDTGEQDDVVAACCAYLRARPALLVVDNCEHVADAAADLVERLVEETTTQTRLVATSRVPLGLRDEQLFQLQPLPLPAAADERTVAAVAANPAVALFVDRATKVDRAFRLDESTIDSIVALCVALDGLPLALELAAGRTAVLGVDDLLDRLDRRLDLLGSNRRDTEHRHRTLRATLEWSFELLRPECQRFFRFLSVFPAGLELAGVEWLGEQLHLVGDPVSALEGLVDSSLVLRTITPSGTRYGQLETMRAYGIDLLTSDGELERAEELLVEWALELSQRAMVGTTSPAEGVWDDRVRRELANLRAARVELRARGRHVELVALSGHLDEWARLRDVSELWTWADELLALTDLDESTLAHARAIGALAAWRRGRHEETIALARAVTAGHPDQWARARALSAQGVGHLFQADFAAATRIWEERVAIDGHLTDAANAELARAYGGDVDQARRAMIDLRTRAAQADWPSARAWCDYVTGEIESVAGSPDAIAWLERAMAQAAEVGGAFAYGVAGVTLCSVTAASGDTAGAALLYRDLIAHWLRSGTWTQQWTTLRHSAALLRHSDPALALGILDAARRDPYAPGMDDAARATEEALRLELAAATAADGTETLAATIDREELAEQVRGALDALAAQLGGAED